MNILNEVGSRESDASARDSFIVSVTQPVRYSFACHVSCKVKYYWKVANVGSEVSRGSQWTFICTALSFHEPNQLSAVDHYGSRTQSKESCYEETNGLQSALNNQLNRIVFSRQPSCRSSLLFLRR